MNRPMLLSAVLILLAIASPRLIAAEPLRLGEGKQPQAAIDLAGNVCVVYGSGKKVFAAISADAGATFSSPQQVAEVPGMPLGMRRGPRVAATANSLVIAAISGAQGGGRDGDVVFWRSLDKGKTWKAGAKPLNTVAGSAREGLHALAAGPGNLFCCVWLDLRNNKTEIWGALSHNGSESWSADALIYKSPGGGTCPCCHPSVAVDAQGAITVMFRNDLNGEKDIYVCRSTDSGRTFSPAAKLGTGTWKLEACPMDGGAITAGGNGAINTIWRRQKNVFVASPAQPERDLGIGEQPTLAAGPGGTFAAWNVSRGGKIRVLTPTSTAPMEIATGTDPVLTGSFDGKGPVLLVYEADGSVRVQQLAARK